MKRATPAWLLLLLACHRGSEPGAPGLNASPVHGRVVGAQIRGGAHEVPDTVLDVELTNTGTRPCSLQGFTVTWGASWLAGHVTCTARGVVAADASSRQTCVVHANSQLGATPGYSDETARVVDVRASCGPTH